MILEDIKEIIAQCDSTDIHLYFITRKLKSDIKKTTKALDKYDYGLYQIDVDSEIQQYLHDLNLAEIDRLLKKKTELSEYDVITDDTEQLFTYSMKNKVLSFSDIIDNKLKNKSKIPKITSFDEFLDTNVLWSYCVGFNYKSNKWLYTFRKLMASRVAIDHTKNPESNFIVKSIKTHFSTKSKKLELLHSDIINLDRQVDCVYLDETFYIAQKRQFEQIVGLEEEYKDKANETVEELKKSGIIDGLELISAEIESNPSIHKKLVRLSKSGVLDGLDSSTLTKIKKVAELFGEKLTVKKGKIVIADKSEIDGTIRLLCDYYKEGKITGKNYGTFSGKILPN
jgi:hypothetical protein